jgi:hypothetical protein
VTPLLTIFTAPKPFYGGHIELIQRNAISSWKALGVGVAVALVGDEEGIKEAASDLGVAHLPKVKKNADGTPLISWIFDLARGLNQSPLLAYVNADVILLPDFIKTAKQVLELAERFLVVGQRFDLDIREPLKFTEGWEFVMRENLQLRGRLHPPMGSDYFIFPRDCFKEIPDFAVGRAGWDNWMIFKGRREGWKVVDASGSITAIHQDHDYSHLPEGKPHYRLPESDENVRLAGGKKAIFHLEDCSILFQDGKLVSPVVNCKRVMRETETFPIRRLHSAFLTQVFFAIFHPVKAYREFRFWLGGIQKPPVEAGKES